MGFVKIPSDLTEWEWFDDKNTTHVYLWLFLKAAWSDKKYKGVEIKRGQTVTTYPEISEKCKISIQQSRTVLERLKSTGKITVKKTPKFSIITLIDYDCDIINNSQNNSLSTANQQFSQQSINSPTLYNTEDKNIKGEEDKLPPTLPSFALQIQNLWNSICISYPQINSLSENRLNNIGKILNQHSIENIETVFRKAEASEFLKGSNERGWCASFDWIMNIRNFEKTFEGNYDEKWEPQQQNLSASNKSTNPWNKTKEELEKEVDDYFQGA